MVKCLKVGNFTGNLIPVIVLPETIPNDRDVRVEMICPYCRYKMCSNYIKIYYIKKIRLYFVDAQFFTVFNVFTVILSDLSTYGSQREIGYCTMRQRQTAVTFSQVNMRLLVIINQL